MLIRPQTDRILLHLELTTSLAHGEAGANRVGPSNLSLLHRQLALLPVSASASLAGDPLLRISATLNLFLVGDQVLPFLDALDGPQVLACLLVSLFPQIYSGEDGEGVGLFSGMQRYQYLSTRLGDAVVSCTTLGELWAVVSRHLGLPHPVEEWHAPLLALCTLLPQTQAAVMHALRQTLPLLMMGGREIAESVKCCNPRYATRASRPLQQAVVPTLSDAQRATFQQALPERQAVLLPALSGNALRHVLLRAPGAVRLLQALGLDPQHDAVPVGVERFLFGGGNTAAKVSTPSNADLLETTVRARYPFVDALGGAVDRFLFSRSQVAIASWIVCREHNAATEEIAGLTSQVSLLDTIYEETRTRAGIGGKDAASGQMIFSYEVLPLGTQVLVEIRFQPWTSPRTKGAMQQAVQDWYASGACLGAKNAQGHGVCRVLRAELPYAQEAADYLISLETEREALAAGLRDATFGTGMVLCAQI